MTATNLDIVVRLNVVIALHRQGHSVYRGRPGDVLRLPISVAAPLISARLVVLVDQRAPLTCDLRPPPNAASLG